MDFVKFQCTVLPISAISVCSVINLTINRRKIFAILQNVSVLSDISCSESIALIIHLAAKMHLGLFPFLKSMLTECRLYPLEQHMLKTKTSLFGKYDYSQLFWKTLITFMFTDMKHRFSHSFSLINNLVLSLLIINWLSFSVPWCYKIKICYSYNWKFYA